MTSYSSRSIPNTNYGARTIPSDPSYSVRPGPRIFDYFLIDVDGDSIIDVDGNFLQIYTDPGYYSATTYTSRIIP